jgi:hypothetical protein
MSDLLDEIEQATAQPSLFENAQMLKVIADKVPGSTGPTKNDLLKSLNDVGDKLQHQGKSLSPVLFFLKLRSCL